jgi:signal transduction histidine kinase/AmiR/NasT family two-component response regulator
MLDAGHDAARARSATAAMPCTEDERQKALFKTGALQAAILNSANFSSIATDERGVIQLFNVGAERMLGYAAAEVINRITPADISDPDELQARARSLSAELDTLIRPGFEALVFKARRGIEDAYELTYICKDGSRLPAVVSVTALKDAAEAIIGYLLIGTDNTARRRVEAERHRLDAVLQLSLVELEKAKLAAEAANLAKSDFLSCMSHELRSPLNAILGFAQLMQTGAPPPTPGQADSIEQILQAGWYLLALINEILDLALIESGRISMSLEPTSLAEVLGDCRAMFEPQAHSSGISINFPVADEPWLVRADRTRVKQVLVNLLTNAIKYNCVDGRVDVRCSAAAPGRLRVSLQDTGAGLSAAKLDQLFQPFNRLGQEAGVQEGTGIGLVVSKRLVELMGGSIGVHSTVGVGSTFWFELATSTLELPIDEPADLLAGGSARLARPADAAPRRTLLCVEDNPANLLLVQRLLERRPDIHLLSARDGRQGVELARACRPDLVLMDINLPGISGLTALRILADDPATRHIPVIALSANAMPHDVAKGLQAGFFRYLTKPIKVPEFMATLDLALALTSRPVALAGRPVALTSRPGALTSRPGGDAAPTEPEHRREYSGRVNAGQRHAAGKPI